MIGADALVHGIVLGLVYGVLAVGLVLVYRASGVVNFAHGETGALGAAVLAKLVLDEHWPFLAALPVALALGAAIGAATQLLIARRLENRPRLVLLVATIGLAQLLLVAELLMPSIKEIAPFPSMLHRQLTIGSVVLTGRDFVPLAVVPALVVVLGLWLARTPSGRALRAVGDNRDAAALAGIRTRRTALVAWSVAGAVATATAVMANPLQGVIVGRATESLGAGLMVRALAAALAGRLRSLPWALAGGVAVGILQAIAGSAGLDPAIADLFLLVFVLAVTIVRPTESPSSEGAFVPVAPVRHTSARVWSAVAGVAALAALMPVAFGRSSQLFDLSRIALYAVVGLSLVLLTGWAGQLSLGQFALVGVGTFTAAVLERNGVPFLVTVPAAVAVGALVSLVIGLPALRVRGLELAVTTLAFAVACSTWLFTRSRLLDAAGVVTVGPPRFLRGPVAYYEACLVVLGAVLAFTVGVRRARLGRRLLAVRSNEHRAATIGVSPLATKLTAFAISGAAAALAGAFFGALRVRSSAADFGPDESLRIVALTVIGGAGSAVGAVVGAVFVLGVPVIFGDTTIAGLLPSGIGLLLLAVLFPGGLAEIGARWARRVRPGVPPGVPADNRVAPLGSLPGVRWPHGSRSARLEVVDVTVRFEGRVALDRVSLSVEPGCVLGLIGANGAGKSTLLDVISGFIIPTAGSVILDGQALAGHSPTARARAGVGRVLQDSTLFDDLTAGEAVRLASPSRPSAHDVISWFGLGDLVGTPCQLLPTAARRRVELACAVVRRPALLLLDEPTAGLGSAESSAFLPVLAAVREELGCSIVLVEHDVSLVRAAADRMVCLGAGVVLADGPPDEVLAAPAVQSGFIGGPGA